MLQMPIECKGSNFTLLVFYLYNSQPEIIRKALQDKINQAPVFLQNAPIVLNVSALNNNTNWEKMKHAINKTGLRIVGISGCTDKLLKQKIDQSGLPILSEGKESFNLNNTSVSIPQNINKTRIIHTPIRSGQQIYARNTDLILTNNVSAGAELIADGNIHIYGIMRGRALAGANGDRDCQIFCTNFFGELISIAGEYWIIDQIPTKFFGKSVRLYLKDGTLTIQNLN
ncbi:septum site-determining protein MinC [Pantoea sp. Aalb]|uniref:septum site-determining protein MinC n=1 Tax=Pantoea sp. Aalb TaxID=2576762 RepID=UPI00132B3F2B|nr:septum site-determining protein MinC [Pantoea sp. Aalb]MXP67379.1 septum site-determining protein MinC [Pantoea sp. Aalb]